MNPKPTAITLHRASRVLEVTFDDGETFRLPCEYLRVESPSAEVQGHGPEQKVLVAGKRAVGIDAVEPVGHYAVALRFTDGHSTGLYTWAYLHQLGREHAARWAAYEAALAAAGLGRD
ncbi:MAG: gamma-butyrobetaine hydroxylase-like domain-containing protein [Silanimonas sp.]